MATARPAPHAPTRHGRHLALLALWSLLAAAWAMALPIAATPDENDHLVRAAALVRGQITGTREEVPTDTYKGARTVVLVPSAYAGIQKAPNCFRGEVEKSAKCQDPILEELGKTSPALTSAGQYNPTYYALVGLPTLASDPETGMRGARILSGVLGAAFLAWAVSAVDRVPGRRAFAWALGVALTPMVFVLGGAVNPNGLEITSAVSLAAALVSLAAAPVLPGPRERVAHAGPLLVQATVSAAVLCAMRPVSPLWAALIVAAGLCAIGVRRVRLLLRERAVLVVAVGAVLTVVWTLGWTLSHGPLVGVGERAIYPQFTDRGTALLFLLSLVDDQLVEAIGAFGWRDAVAPPGVVAAWTGATALLLALVVAARPRARHLVPLLAVVASLVVVPLVIGMPVLTSAGYVWQGRYSLPMLAAAALLAALCIARGRAAEGFLGEALTRFAPVFGAALVVGHAGSLWWAARRYEFGLTPYPKPPDPTEMLPVDAWVWILLGTAAAAGATWVLLRTPGPIAGRGPRDVTPGGRSE